MAVGRDRLRILRTHSKSAMCFVGCLTNQGVHGRAAIEFSEGEDTPVPVFEYQELPDATIQTRSSLGYADPQ